MRTGDDTHPGGVTERQTAAPRVKWATSVAITATVPPRSRPWSGVGQVVLDGLERGGRFPEVGDRGGVEEIVL